MFVQAVYTPPLQDGVAAALRKCREATSPGADGAVVKKSVCFEKSIGSAMRAFIYKPPSLRLLKEREYFLMAHPPRLGKAGNIPAAIDFTLLFHKAKNEITHREQVHRSIPRRSKIMRGR